MLQFPKIPACKAIADKPTHKILLMQSNLQQNATFVDFAAEKDVQYAPSEVTLNYENFNYQEALKQILPEGIEIPGGFEAIGDVAHLNLHVNQMPFKLQIGQVILDKNPSLRTVVTKIGHIDSTFRFYELECIAGEPKYETIVIEDKVKFKVDVSKMYWCSKLSQERNRIIDQFFKDGEVLCDMFCGVGPLSVKAAVKRPNLKVLANDLNPDGVAFLK